MESRGVMVTIRGGGELLLSGVLERIELGIELLRR